MKKGNIVQVYYDPISCQNKDFVGEVREVIRKEAWTDWSGNHIYRCAVLDGPNNEVYVRDVSQILDH
jgi:hypothetical protein